MANFIGEALGLFFAAALVMPIIIIFYLINHSKEDTNGDGLSG